ncbi:hypothetical protein M0R45_015040 [Rubus argutus]|uniref:Uncharacterized protein n=1 Tax=Rubus argutus TaxID=59490 RepID=A0AAW1XQ45_RUBAR
MLEEMPQLWNNGKAVSVFVGAHSEVPYCLRESDDESQLSTLPWQKNAGGVGLSSERVGHGLSSAALELEYDWTENGAAKSAEVQSGSAVVLVRTEHGLGLWLGMLRWAGARVLHGVDGSSDG